MNVDPAKGNPVDVCQLDWHSEGSSTKDLRGLTDIYWKTQQSQLNTLRKYMYDIGNSPLNNLRKEVTNKSEARDAQRKEMNKEKGKSKKN